MFSSTELHKALTTLRVQVRNFDPSIVPGPDAVRLVSLFSEIERLGAAGKVLAIRRVEETRAYCSSGHQDAASFTASTTGVTRAEAVGVVGLGQQLSELPATDAAFRSGALSEKQAAAVARGATAAPDAEPLLLDIAQKDSLSTLTRKARNLISSKSASAEVDHHESQRVKRRCSIRSREDGMVSVWALLLPEEGARFKTSFEKHRAKIFREARRTGRREPLNQYDADAFMRIVDDSGGGEKIKPTVNVIVDYQSLIRGYRETGETCEIPGLGPLPVVLVNEMLSDAFLRTIVVDGTDIKAISTRKRTIPTALRAALEMRDQHCQVPGCEERRFLEIDHIKDFAKGGPTSLKNTVRMCHWHHRQKTYKGFRLVGKPGNRQWVGPREPGGWSEQVADTG